MRRFAAVLALLLLAGSATLAPAAPRLSVVVDTEAFRKTEAEAIAEMLRAIGVDADVRVWEAAALREKIARGERQMVLTDWGSANHEAREQRLSDAEDYLLPQLAGISIGDGADQPPRLDSGSPA